MTINRNLWLDTFYENRIPEWFCPTCKKGFLKLSDNGFIYGKTSDTIKKEELNDHILMHDIYEFSYRFSIFLKCSNEDCQEIVVGCGKGFFNEEYTTWVDELGEYAPEPVLVFSPVYFSPPLDLFSVPRQCPDVVIKEIYVSFSLFFADPPASANSVRKVIEKILDAEGITRSTKNGGFLRLDGKPGEPSRINFFEQKLMANNQETKIIEYFRAIKFIGNDGSHADEITKDDVLDAYAILELILEDLYVKGRQETESLAAKIIAAKKPLSKVKNSGN